MEKLGFQNAGINHLIWKKKIRSLLDGKSSTSDIKQVSHKECELGRWLYAKGLKEFGQLKEMREMEALHIEIHNMSNKIIRLIDEEKKGAAEVEYKKLDMKSKDMIRILTLLSVQVESDKEDEGKK